LRVEIARRDARSLALSIDKRLSIPARGATVAAL